MHGMYEFLSYGISSCICFIGLYFSSFPDPLQMNRHDVFQPDLPVCSLVSSLLGYGIDHDLDENMEW